MMFANLIKGAWPAPLVLLLVQMAYAQPYPGKVILKDNTILSGFVKPNHDDGIFYGAAEADVTRAISPAEIQSFTIDVNGTNEQYIYMDAALPLGKTNDNTRPRLMKIVQLGKVALYEYQLNSALGFAMGGDCEVLYVKRDADPQPVMLCYVVHSMMSGAGYNRPKFKEFAADYFKDCPALAAKISKKEFKPRHYRDIVTYYNNDCK